MVLSYTRLPVQAANAAPPSVVSPHVAVKTPVITAEVALSIGAPYPLPQSALNVTSAGVSAGEVQSKVSVLVLL